LTMDSGYLQTVRGPVSAEGLGLILPHEHLFTDLRGPGVSDYAQAEPKAVVEVVEPYLTQAHSAGVTALVECSTVGVGRNLDVLRHLAESSPIHIVAPTGIYREWYTPPQLRETSAEELAAEWVRDLTEGIEGSQVSAGFVKIAISYIYTNIELCKLILIFNIEKTVEQ